MRTIFGPFCDRRSSGCPPGPERTGPNEDEKTASDRKLACGVWFPVRFPGTKLLREFGLHEGGEICHDLMRCPMQSQELWILRFGKQVLFSDDKKTVVRELRRTIPATALATIHKGVQSFFRCPCQPRMFPFSPKNTCVCPSVHGPPPL